MLNANELRLGNLIASWENGLAGKPVHVTLRILKHLSETPIGSENLMFKAIRFTTDIVRECGFHKSEDNGFGELQLEAFTKEAKIYFKNGYCYLMHKTGVCLTEPIMYVHELQNLYHSITGKELKVNL